MIRKVRRKLFRLGIFVAILLAIMLQAIKSGKLTTVFVDRYDVRGVDVSHYQGKIDWEVLSKQNISFAFIKATEGSSYVDENFAKNLKKARKTSLKIGTYHFFSYESTGKEQAKHYIKTVKYKSGMLCPVVDVELYGKYQKNPPKKEDVIKELNDMLLELEDKYGVKPMIYTTMKIYQRYFTDEFLDYPFWIRNIYYKPDLTMNRDWVFWQYSEKGMLEGYSGGEKYIDMNVFNGDEQKLDAMTLK